MMTIAGVLMMLAPDPAQWRGRNLC
jgi:hypothetical protein